MIIRLRTISSFSVKHPQSTGTYQQQIDLPTALPTGVYILNLISSNGQVAVKVFKE